MPFFTSVNTLLIKATMAFSLTCTDAFTVALLPRAPSPSLQRYQTNNIGHVSTIALHSTPSETQTNESEEVPHTAMQEILRLRGPVAQGYGRGGKKLGVPTANLPESLFSNALSQIPTGVYFGWAMIEDLSSPTASKKVGRNKHHKAVVNVGYSPTFVGEENREKIVEAHLILDHPEEDVEGDFYNETMRLSLIGSLRPEQKFDSFPELLAAIHNDIKNAKEALMIPPYSILRDDPFLVVEEENIWVGGSGGNDDASWEFEDATKALKKTTVGN